jgi:hypothetical protein
VVASVRSLHDGTLQLLLELAPEVQGLLRLQEAGMRIEEIPVDMRPRASGESKLQGKKALMVVLTIAGTLLALDRWRRK